MPNDIDAYYGKDQPSASFKWGVIVPVLTVVNDPPFSTKVPKWTAVAWFKSRKRADEYARTGWASYAIARMNR